MFHTCWKEGVRGCGCAECSINVCSIVSGGLSVLLRPCRSSVYQFCRFPGEEPESPAVILDLSIFLFASFRFYSVCLEALASDAYTFRTVLPCWQSNRPFIMECPALSPTGFLVPKSTLPNMNRATPAFLSLAFAWSLFSPTWAAIPRSLCAD